jgi:uncharacterized protein
VKLLIISDTHGDYPLAVRAVDAAGPVDLIVHLGDCFDDARVIETIADVPVLKVPGNCDPGMDAERELLVTLADKTVMFTHGDRYEVKSGLSRLHKRAMELKVNIVLYGHTHHAAIDTLGDILFINPGSLNAKSSQAGYAVLTIDQGNIEALLVPL